MLTTRPPEGGSPLANLKRLARRPTETESCDLCSAPIGPLHRHLLELEGRKILCTCDACGLRFEGVVGGRYKLIPRRGRMLGNLDLSDEEWASLALPIDLAFMFYSSPAGKPIALYPSPAGAVESLLPMVSWKALVDRNPELTLLEPDTEALLINRTAGAREYYVAPIDACFEMAGLVRRHWRGLTGGTEVWKQIEEFLKRLKSDVAPRAAASAGEVGHA